MGNDNDGELFLHMVFYFGVSSCILIPVEHYFCASIVSVRSRLGE